MSEQLTQPEAQLTDEQMRAIQNVYSDVVRSQAPLLDELAVNPDKDNVSTRDLSVRKEVEVIDSSEVGDHELALRDINSIILKIENGGYDIRDLPKSLQLNIPKGSVSARELIGLHKDRLEDVANVIDARLQKRDRDGDFFDKMKAHNKELDDRARAKEAHARRIESVTSSEVSVAKKRFD